MKKVLLFTLTILTFFACENGNEGGEEVKENTPPSVTVNAADFMDTTGQFINFAFGEDTLLKSESEGAMVNFDVEIPVTGRYRVEVTGASMASEPAAVWLEDYRNNEDDRSYNITGDISMDNNMISTFKREGSPLKAGKHEMRLHCKNVGIGVKSIKFTLMKEHQMTPETLVQNMEGDEWEIVWADEFEGTEVDTSKWTYDIGDWGWGNNELQYYTEANTKNARVEDGNLIIEAHRDANNANSWTSARLTTRGKTTFTYGKIEIKAKVPFMRGTWAAGWTLGDKYRDELSWPYCGEIDIIESVGYDTNDETGDGKAVATVHCGAFYFKKNTHKSSVLEVEDIATEFHTYAIEWTPDGIKAFLDGKQYFEYNDTSNELAWPYNDPQNIILNLAMGGGWGGLQGVDENYDSAQYVIDYVRVYGKK